MKNKVRDKNGFFKKYWFGIILSIILMIFFSGILFKVFDIITNLAVAATIAVLLVIGAFTLGLNFGNRFHDEEKYKNVFKKIAAISFIAAMALIIITILFMIIIPSIIGVTIGTLIIILVAIGALGLGYFSGS